MKIFRKRNSAKLKLDIIRHEKAKTGHYSGRIIPLLLSWFARNVLSSPQPRYSPKRRLMNIPKTRQVNISQKMWIAILLNKCEYSRQLFIKTRFLKLIRPLPVNLSVYANFLFRFMKFWFNFLFLPISK